MTTLTVKRQYDEGDGLEVTFFDNGVVIGKACTVAYKGKPNAFLHSFKVNEQYRRKGYGTQILKYMIENFCVETLYVDKDSEAIKLYKRFGFYTLDTINNMIIMQRKMIYNGKD